MNLKPYPKPTCSQRIKIAFHYLLPQLIITRAAGWFAEKKWGVSRILSLNILPIIIALIGKNLKNLNLLILKHLINFLRVN